MTIDEDDTLEVTSWGGGTYLIHYGLDVAMLNARAAYVHGRIEVEEFEAEVDRLLRKRAALR